MNKFILILPHLYPFLFFFLSIDANLLCSILRFLRVESNFPLLIDPQPQQDPTNKRLISTFMARLSMNKNYLIRYYDYPIKLKTTKNKTRQQKAKSPKAFSGETDPNSVDDVSCKRRETAKK